MFFLSALKKKFQFCSISFYFSRRIISGLGLAEKFEIIKIFPSTFFILPQENKSSEYFHLLIISLIFFSFLFQELNKSKKRKIRGKEGNFLHKKMRKIPRKIYSLLKRNFSKEDKILFRFTLNKIFVENRRIH